jgi:hypothetical protein
MSNLGPIVGHTTTTTTRLWVRCALALGDVTVTPAAPQLFVAKHDVGRGVFVIDIANLQPATKYSVNVKDANGDQIGPTAFVRTFSDGAKAPLRLLFGSCYRQTIATNVWELIFKRQTPRPADALFLIGDQVYADDLWTLNGAELRDAHEARYADVWARPFIRSTLAAMPTYMTWDDHEIADDWGSDPKIRPGESGAEAKFKEIDKVYRSYQLAHSPLGPTAAAGPRDYAVTIGCASVYMLDGRGERGKDVRFPIIGEPQFDRIQAWLDGLPPVVEVAILASPVPPSFLNNQAMQSAMDMGFDLLKDAADLWTYWGHKELELRDNRPDFMRLMTALFKWQEAVEGRRVVVVGGDVHFSYAHRIFNGPKNKNKKKRENLLEFVASAFAATTIHPHEQDILKEGMGGKEFQLVQQYRAGLIKDAITFEFNYGEVLIDPVERTIELAVITQSEKRISFHTETY